MLACDHALHATCSTCNHPPGVVVVVVSIPMPPTASQANDSVSRNSAQFGAVGSPMSSPFAVGHFRSSYSW